MEKTDIEKTDINKGNEQSSIIITDNQDGTYTVNGQIIKKEDMTTEQMEIVKNNALFDKAWNEVRGAVDEIIFIK